MDGFQCVSVDYIAAEFAIEHDDYRAGFASDTSDEAVTHHRESVVARRGVPNSISVVKQGHGCP